MRARHRLAACLVGSALLAGCGSDHGAKAQFNQVRRDCGTLVGATVAEAVAKLAIAQEGYWPASSCTTNLATLGSSDVCGGSPGADYTVPVCQLAFEYCAPGTSLCSGGAVGGCAYDCELRVAAATPGDVKGTSTICATRFLSGQPAGLISFRICQ